MKSWLSLKIEIKNPFYNIIIYIWKCTFVVISFVSIQKDYPTITMSR